MKIVLNIHVVSHRKYSIAIILDGKCDFDCGVESDNCIIDDGISVEAVPPQPAAERQAGSNLD